MPIALKNAPYKKIYSEEDTEKVVRAVKNGISKRRRPACMTFLVKAPQNSPFQNNTPGNGWLKAFIKQHLNLRHRISEAVTSASTVVSANDIRGWFTTIDDFLKDDGHTDILKDASRHLCTFEADGYVTPPYIIFPYERRTLDISRTIPDKWAYGISDNGWMNVEVFYEYISALLYSAKNKKA
ncbi:hypothetical protein NQ314_004518 [Rhamnusium bicolor]|uniref:HTH CENPB-type domain-containing protein n=1 Tax=Rhamnusium bicolor TaxID=1586634 RepID=A0AAV8ZJS4_9CUCU|nr:hypothetical protein NQ314_004518 [Rhamnusium bicolor]